MRTGLRRSGFDTCICCQCTTAQPLIGTDKGQHSFLLSFCLYCKVVGRETVSYCLHAHGSMQRDSDLPWDPLNGVLNSGEMRGILDAVMMKHSYSEDLCLGEQWGFDPSSLKHQGKPQRSANSLLTL